MRRHVTAMIAAICVANALTACSSDSGPESVVRAFLEGWPAGKLDSIGFVDSTGVAIPANDVVSQIKTLSGDLVKQPLKLSSAGKPQVTKDDATAPVAVSWTVANGVTWDYRTTLRLNRKNDAWRVVWTPSTVHPELLLGDKLGLQTLAAERGGILDGAGQAIVRARPVVVVGIEPRRVTNQSALLSALDAAFKSVGVGLSLADLPGRLASAKPDAFVEVVTLRREAYDRIRDRIRDLDGTVFREETLQLAPSRAFARALLGAVGDARKDQLDANPGKYSLGDQVGQSGLQERYDDQLRGTPGVRVAITGRPAGTDGTPAPEQELFAAKPVAGKPLKTTLDQRIQNAADAALAAQRNRAAIVAVRVSDGAIVAVANGPDGGELNLAFTAQVPPGSTFKMVTALGLLDANAVGLDTPVRCPRTYEVSGRTFNNSNNFELGTVPFRVDFAKSCNTAFASLAPKLGGDGLRKAAASVGVGTTWNLGADVFTGSVPADASPVDAAAAAFGQGTTLVSPVALAAASAAVARGSWQAPKLFAEPPTTPGPPPSPAAGPSTPDGTALNAASVSALRTMMREVVTVGTGSALADVPGAPVHAKTGTAEFDNNPAHTHAWTVGWQGDLAFVVFVEKGGTSTATAVPIVESFLSGLR